MKKVMLFSAVWCGPCNALKMVIDKANLQTPIEQIDVDTNHELVAQYQIRGVPTLVVLNKDGTEFIRKSGFMSESQLREFVGE